MLADKPLLHVEVVYALPEKQIVVPVEVNHGDTVAQAIGLSGVLKYFPALDLSTARMGVCGKVVRAETPVRDGDRIEIYRALICNPKEVRAIKAKTRR